MAVDLNSILGGQNMTGVINARRGGVPAGLVPPNMVNGTRTVLGNTAKFKIVRNSRRTTQAADYGSPSKTMEQVEMDEVSHILYHSVHNQLHDVNTFANIMDPNNMSRQRLGVLEIRRQADEFARRFMNTRWSMVYSTLAKGAVWFDGDGNLLNSDTGAVRSVVWDIPADHLGQLGGIIDVPWSTSSAKILTDIEEIQQKAMEDTGHPIIHALYGKNVPSYILGNDEINGLLVRESTPRAQMLTGTIANGMLGIANWWPVHGAFYETHEGSVARWFGDDDVVFLPAVSTEWWDVPEGSMTIPNSFQPTRDPASALANVSEVFGMFSYAKLNDDPVTIKHVAGDTILYGLRNPAAIFIATVAGF